MENRTIRIANTKTQKKYAIESSATTLGELKAQLDLQGIDYAGMTFTEGITKTSLISNESLLPTNVMYKGQPTNELVILLTNTTKNISSGADRKMLYAKIKELHLEEQIKERFGTNYTRVGNVDLESIISEAVGNGTPITGTDEEIITNNAAELEKNGVHAETAQPTPIPDVKSAPHPEAVEWYYMGLKAMVKSNLLYIDDIAVIADLTSDLYRRLNEERVRVSDKDIDEMIMNL